MKTLETDITVGSDGRAVVELVLPPDVPAGRHRAVVVLDERASAVPEAETPPPVVLLPLGFQGWPKESTFRREELYGDDGR